MAETYGEEVTSVQQTADLWTKNVSVYIGPQETCEHEAFMAAAFNLPMISYVSIFVEPLQMKLFENDYLICKFLNCIVPFRGEAITFLACNLSRSIFSLRHNHPICTLTHYSGGIILCRKISHK